jgi:hypothetical protein
MAKEPDNGDGPSIQRRRMLQVAVTGGIVGGAALLPKKWVRPVVQSIVVPAHAATSLPTSTSSAPGTGTTTLQPGTTIFTTTTEPPQTTITTTTQPPQTTITTTTQPPLTTTTLSPL